ncbi:MAG: PAS domain-containing protein [Methanomicrobiales archaeon]|nr:PAS domain-containing protein [Methanomicrobiales archaeon]
MTTILLFDSELSAFRRTIDHFHKAGISCTVAATPGDAADARATHTNDWIAVRYSRDATGEEICAALRSAVPAAPLFCIVPEKRREDAPGFIAAADGVILDNGDPCRCADAIRRLKGRYFGGLMPAGILVAADALLAGNCGEETVFKALQELGAMSGADRIAVWEDNDSAGTDMPRAFCRFEWERPHVPGAGDGGADRCRHAAVELPETFRELSRDRVMTWRYDNGSETERQFLLLRGASSLRAVPFGTSSAFKGFVSIEFRDEPWLSMPDSNGVVDAGARIIGRSLWDLQEGRSTIGNVNIIRTLLDAIPDSAMLFDDAFRFLAANRTTLRCMANIGKKTALDISDVVGREFMDFMPPELAASRKKAIEEVVRTKKPVVLMEDYGGKSFESRILPVPDRSGNVSMLAVVSRNITVQKNARKTLHLKHDILYGMIENSSDMLAAIDTGFRFIGFNSAYKRQFELIFGTNLELGVRLQDLLAHLPEQKDKAMHLWGRALEGEEYRVEAQFGTPEYCEIVFNTLKNHEGAIIGATHVVRDITAHKRAEEALRQANKKLNLLSSITRHDIRNQLTVLNGHLEMMAMSGNSNGHSEAIDKCLYSSGAILKHLEFSRDYQEIGSHKPQWFNMAWIIGRAAGQFDTGVSIQAEVDGLKIYADVLLEKVFYNLIDNALHHGGERLTTIRFSMRESPDGLLLLCEDDGIGVARPQKELIFSHGYGSNTGLGLFLITEILQITGIAIRETGIPGKGARFELQVPEGAFRLYPSKGGL